MWYLAYRFGTHRVTMTLREYLRAHDLTVTEFAGRLSVSRVAVSRYLSGQRMPRRAVLQEISAATGGAVLLTDFVGLISHNCRQRCWGNE